MAALVDSFDQLAQHGWKALFYRRISNDEELGVSHTAVMYRGDKPAEICEGPRLSMACVNFNMERTSNDAYFLIVGL